MTDVNKGSAAAPTTAAKGGPGMVAVVDPSSEPSLDQLVENWASVQARVKTATEKSGRSWDVKDGAEPSVRLVAVSKTKSTECLQRAYDAGVRVFGENYVQEIVEKVPKLPKDIHWRFIGHLQSNKAKDVVSKVGLGLTCVETVDSTNLANKLNTASLKYRLRAAEGKAVAPASTPSEDSGRSTPSEEAQPKKGKKGGNKESTPTGTLVPLRVMVQVNTSGEESKSGVEPTADAVTALCSHILTQCPALELEGLMTIGMPDFSPNPECFQRLLTCRTAVLQAFPEVFCDTPDLTTAGAGSKLRECRLSMGMSGDFENAILSGSSNVRVGSSIFGARSYKPKADPVASAAPVAGDSKRTDTAETGDK